MPFYNREKNRVAFNTLWIEIAQNDRKTTLRSDKASAYVDFVNRNCHSSKNIDINTLRKLKRSFLEEGPLHDKKNKYGKKKRISNFGKFFLT